MTTDLLTPQGSDKRVHPRVPTALTGRISIGAKQIVEDCLVVDLSVGGAGLQHQFQPPQSGLVCQLDVSGFGRFDGITAHYGPSTLGVRFLFGEAERLKLYDRLKLFVLEGVMSGNQAQTRGTAHLRTSSGRIMPCEVVNISLRDALLRAEIKPSVGEMVSVGRAYGRVVVHQPEGFGVEFLQFMGA
jgi:hypothetical protein